MPNGIITGYQINIEVLTPLQTSDNRKKRQTASLVHPSCIPDNTTGIINVTSQSFLDLNVGKTLPRLTGKKKFFFMRNTFAMLMYLQSINLSPAAPFTLYQYSVRAVSDQGQGDYSPFRNFSTPTGGKPHIE